jgi:hypothetical protein
MEHRIPDYDYGNLLHTDANEIKKNTSNLSDASNEVGR